MRKRSTYRPKAKGHHMLINRGMINDSIEMDERITIEAFASGWAGTQHYDQIADMRDCLMLAAAHKKDQSALAMCQGVRVVMDNIRARYAEKSQFGVTGDELQLLRHFVDIYRDFWLRQPVHLYEAAVEALDKLRLPTPPNA